MASCTSVGWLVCAAHWEYNTDTIASTFSGKVDRLHGPISSYHPNKTAGDQTHVPLQHTHIPTRSC